MTIHQQITQLLEIAEMENVPASERITLLTNGLRDLAEDTALGDMEEVHLSEPPATDYDAIGDPWQDGIDRQADTAAEL